MADAGSRVKTALDEVRILVLGAQILLGFELRAVFEPGFKKLDGLAQKLTLVSLALQLVMLAVLLLPAAWHRIVERGQATPRLERTTQRCAALVLGVFAVVIGLDLKLAASRIVGRWAIAWGAAAAVVALVFWFGIELVERRKHGHPMPKEESVPETPLHDRIQHVLTEARVVLPGAQALLGFQLITVLLDAFDALPRAAKLIHLGSTALVGLATVLLMTPAAFHRLVERGDETEHFHRFASKTLLAALVPLALGMAADFGVVVFQVTRGVRGAIAAGAACLVLFYGLWFGLTLAIRGAKQRQAERSPRELAPGRRMQEV